MGDEVQEGSGTGAEGAESASTETTDGAANNAAAEGAQGAGETGAEEGGDGEDLTVTDDVTGKKYWPEEAALARINKLTAQVKAAREEAMEALRKDPEFQKQLMAQAKGAEDVSASAGEGEPSPFEQFLAPLPKEHQAHYRAFGQAMAAEVQTFVNQALEQAIGPIKSWMGEQKVQSFAQKTGDYPKYQKQIEKIMAEGRASSIEDAYRLASWDDKIKAAQNAGARDEASRQKKLSAFPSSKATGGVNVKQKANSLRDALLRAGQEHGYTA